jgi:hypothetical protein
MERHDSETHRFVCEGLLAAAVASSGLLIGMAVTAHTDSAAYTIATRADFNAASARTYQPGDQILLERGVSFSGTPRPPGIRHRLRAPHDRRDRHRGRARHHCRRGGLPTHGTRAGMTCGISLWFGGRHGVVGVPKGEQPARADKVADSPRSGYWTTRTFAAAVHWPSIAVYLCFV